MESFRKSSYIIPIRLEGVDNKYLLIHGYTGAIDVVDSNLKNYLFSDRTISLDKFPFSEEVFNILKTRGYLTSINKEEERQYAYKIADLLQKKNERILKHFTIVVTYNCNFNCPYCYEKEHIKRNGNNFSTVISEKMIDKVFDIINKIEPDSRLHKKVIHLFGGEPLLKENKSIIEYIVKKGEGLGFKFSATSNGYDLNYFEDLLGVGKIESIQVTIDGYKELHNRRRTHYIEKGSFDRIIDNIKIALNKDISVIVRVNVDSENIKEISKIESCFSQLGLFEYGKFTFYAIYMGGEVNYNPQSYNESGKQKISIRDFYKSCLNVRQIQYDVSLYRRVLFALKNKRPIYLSSFHCEAQSSAYIFDPFGYIYSCLECVGNVRHAIGKYSNELEWLSKKNEWHKMNLSDKCIKCKYILLCAGGCLVKSQKNGQAYCDSFPIKLKAAVNKAYKQYINN